MTALISRSLSPTINKAIADLKPESNWREMYVSDCLRMDVNFMVGYGIKRRTNQMKMSYNKLWKLLIDKKMKKSDLRKNAKISSSALAKLTNAENVITDVLGKICNELKYDMSNIMEFVSGELTNSEEGKTEF